MVELVQVASVPWWCGVRAALLLEVLSFKLNINGSPGEPVVLGHVMPSQIQFRSLYNFFSRPLYFTCNFEMHC